MTAGTVAVERNDARSRELDRALIRTRLASLKEGDGRQAAHSDLLLTQKLVEDGGLQAAQPPAHLFPTAATATYAPPTSYTRAAVLVPLVEHADGYAVLLTQRTAALNKHAGQVAFPGGRMDPEDVDEVACALRETREEIGLAPDKVEVLGRLGSWTTGTGFDITPIVGAVSPPLDLKPDPAEVAAIFEVPLAFFLDPANHRRVVYEFSGVSRAFYEMPYGDRYIWGATAAMLINLYYALLES
jgi:8-oxo-dGTP pyrophosphatase MutT (NUDIX family)